VGYLSDEALREEMHRFVEIAYTSILPAALAALPQLSYALNAPLVKSSPNFPPLRAKAVRYLVGGLAFGSR
jgi:hypothetical protein